MWTRVVSLEYEPKKNNELKAKSVSASKNKNKKKMSIDNRLQGFFKMNVGDDSDNLNIFRGSNLILTIILDYRNSLLLDKR